MLVAVLGARGLLGRRVVQQARARGAQVRAISPHAQPGEFGPDVECLAASDADPAALAAAFAGCEAVVVVFPATLARPEAYPGQVARVFEAARAARVPRVVGLIGSAGALTASGERLVDTDYFQETTRHFYQHVHAAWQAYRREQLPEWVAFVPAARMQVHMADRGTYRTRTDERLVVTDERSRRYFDVSQVSYGDCAQALVDEVLGPRHSHCFVSIGY